MSFLFHSVFENISRLGLISARQISQSVDEFRSNIMLINYAMRDANFQLIPNLERQM
jgi:hypothetical protein